MAWSIAFPGEVAPRCLLEIFQEKGAGPQNAKRTRNRGPKGGRLVFFDPFGWMERVLPAVWIHAILRAGAVVVFSWFLWRRLGEYDRFLLKPLWALETVIYGLFLVAYLVRRAPRSRSRGWREILVPLVGAMAPFAFLLTPPGGPVGESREGLQAIFWGMTGGTALTVWALWTVRRSFSITVEARELVTEGPFRFFRHPMYLGEIVTGGAVVCWRPSVWNTALFASFVFLQLLRARMEENKLFHVFGEDYGTFASSRWWFLPWRQP